VISRAAVRIRSFAIGDRMTWEIVSSLDEADLLRDGCGDRA
jgi:hypothetical protein